MKGLYKYLEPRSRIEEKEYVIRNSNENENYYRKSENIKLKISKNHNKKLNAKEKLLNEREEDLNKREESLMNEKRQFELDKKEFDEQIEKDKKLHEDINTERSTLIKIKSNNEKKEKEIQLMNDKLKKEKDDIEKKKKELQNKENELKEKEGAINNKENKINEKEELIKNKEAELIKKENDLNQKLNELNLEDDQLKSKNVPILIGLNNIGATCYMNASLQCFSNTKKLTQYFLEHYEADPKNTMANEYFEVLKNLWNVENNNKSYSPNSFKDLLSKENPLFAGIQANDSKDLINFLLERFHQELNLATKENVMDNEANANQPDQSNEKLMLKYIK